MAVVDWDMNEGWSKPSIVPMAPLSIHPFNSSLHYAVECFEGMKAYKDAQGKIRLFRPECNALRLKRSSNRISLPDFNGEEFIKLLAEYVKVEQRWIPSISEFSLYLRPLHISMENSLGVKSPGKSKLLILGCPVGPYYPTGFEPISLSCGVGTIRSAPGGTGMYKVGG
jgi:branched-chain amino acid aminotransferase